MNSTFRSFMDKAKDFVKSPNYSLIEVQCLFLSKDVQKAINSLKDFFLEIDTRYQTLDNYWYKIGVQISKFLDFVTNDKFNPNDEVFNSLYKLTNNTIFLQNKTD